MDIKTIKVTPKNTIKDTIEAINNGSIRLAIVVDNENRLLGTISDGDIRRAILKGKQLNDKIDTIYNKNPFFITHNYNRQKLISFCKKNKIYQIPVVNKKNEVIDIFLLDELIEKKEYHNYVIIMAGGIGKRLKPLTEKTPKPMLKIGDKPILEIIIERLRKSGFKNFILSVNYKSEVIENYFGNGSQFGINIKYIKEKKRMGTAGTLALLREKLKDTFILMNGDLLTNLDFSYLLEYHYHNQPIATIAVKKHYYRVPFGMISLDGIKIKSIVEKPLIDFFISAGIYVLEPEVIKFVPENQFFNMPELINELIKNNLEVVSFPIKEYWNDIGRIEDYKKANIDYKVVFNE